MTTDDMDRSVRFYVEVLGFTCGMQTPGYSNLYRDGVRIMLALPNSHEAWTGPRFAGQLYIHHTSGRAEGGRCALVKYQGPCRSYLRT